MSRPRMFPDDPGERSIGVIGNIYSKQGIQVKEVGGRYWWTVYCDAYGAEWEEIPKYLFDALNKFEDES